MLDYLIYLLAFVIGSILGLLYSYKLHGEPYVADSSLDIKTCIMSVVGWTLAINSGSILSMKLGIVILGGIGFLLAGFVISERPGYGRKETAIGLLIAIIVYLLLHYII